MNTVECPYCGYIMLYPVKLTSYHCPVCGNEVKRDKPKEE